MKRVKDVKTNFKWWVSEVNGRSQPGRSRYPPMSLSVQGEDVSP